MRSVVSWSNRDVEQRGPVEARLHSSFVAVGSPDRIRTCDLAVNSRPLYR